MQAIHIGAFYGLISAALFGASTPLAKLLLGAIDPWMLAGLLYAGSGIGLFVLSRFRRGAEARLARRDLPWLAGAILAGGVAGPVLLMMGLAHSAASSAALLLNLEGLATMAIAWFVFREHTDTRIVVGALAILAGAVLLSWQGGFAAIGPGALAIAGACLAWGVDNNLTRKIANADPVQIAMVKGLVAGAANITLAFSLGAQFPAAGIVAAAGVLGFFGYGVSLVLFVLALRHVGAARTGAYFSTAPFIGAVLAVALLAEPVTPLLLAAAALMAVGVYLHVVEHHAHAHVHKPMTHTHAHVHDAHHQHAHGPDDPPGEPHVHAHQHGRLAHSHAHFPDAHHQHEH